MSRKSKIEKMMEDEHILIRPVHESIRLYNSDRYTVSRAREKLAKIVQENDGMERLEELRNKSVQNRNFYTLVGIARRHPKLLHHLAGFIPSPGTVRTNNLPHLAHTYSVSKQYISSVRKKLMDVANSYKITERSLVRKIQKYIQENDG